MIITPHIYQSQAAGVAMAQGSTYYSPVIPSPKGFIGGELQIRFSGVTARLGGVTFATQLLLPGAPLQTCVSISTDTGPVMSRWNDTYVSCANLYGIDLSIGGRCRFGPGVYFNPADVTAGMLPDSMQQGTGFVNLQLQVKLLNPSADTTGFFLFILYGKDEGLAGADTGADVVTWA